MPQQERKEKSIFRVCGQEIFKHQIKPCAISPRGSKRKTNITWTGKMVQWIKSLLHQHEDQSSDPQDSHKNVGMAASHLSSQHLGRTGRELDHSWPNQWTSNSARDPASEKSKWRIKKDTHPLNTCAHIYTSLHTETYDTQILKMHNFKYNYLKNQSENNPKNNQNEGKIDYPQKRNNSSYLPTELMGATRFYDRVQGMERNSRWSKI